MKAQWRAWSRRFAALSLRERAMVAGAVIFGIAFLGYNFGVDPALLRAREATTTVQRATDEAAPLRAQLAVLAAQNADPDAPNRARLEQLRRQLAAAGGKLAGFESGMVPPQKMQSFLEGLLGRNRGVELLGYKTLPVTAIGEKAGPKAGAADAKAASPAAATQPAEGIFQHGVELRVAGSYHDLYNYLAELERMPQRVMWDSVSLSVDKYPRNILTLRIYTLSLDRKWLIV